MNILKFFRWLAAARDLIASIEVDTSGDGGASYYVIGNVSAETLSALGFKHGSQRATEHIKRPAR